MPLWPPAAIPPQPGDIIYFKSSRNQNITNHVGIVTSYSNGTVYTVEGNTSSATVSTNGGAVCSKSYSISNTYIVYICKPNYTTQSSADSLKSVVFDPTYYSDNHADLKEAFGTDATALYDHFQTYGVKEGRQASPSFSVKYYLENNTHVQEAVGNTTDYEAAYKYFLSTGYKKTAKTAQPADLGERFFAKINFSTGKNLSLSGNNVIIYSESDKPAQVWQFIRQANGSYQIVNAKNSMNLSTTGNSNTSGTNVEIAVGAGDSGQRWFLYPSGSKYILRPYCSAYCMLDVADGSTADLTNIQIHTANNAKAQKFSINKVDYSASEAACDLGDDVFVKISNVASGNFLATSNNNIVSVVDKASATRVFRLMHESDGAYRIVGQNSNKTITVEGAADADGTNVHATTNSSLTSQRWYICRLGEHYTLRPVSSTDRRMEVADGSTVSGANVQIGTFTGGERYYYDANGNQVTGWLTQGGKTYYLDPATGVMATGTTEIDGVSYDFGTDGVLVADADCAHESHDAEGVCISCREDVGHSYTSVVTGATCEAQGYTTYTCTCGHSYDSDYTAANGHTFVAGSCEVCEAPDPTPTVVPTLTLSYPNLNFESRVEYNIYYTAQDLDNVEEMGLITFTEPMVDGTIEEADDVIPGYITSGQHYMVHTHGISPRFLSDALYFRVYAKLTDGTYVYSDTAAYHAVAYAKDILARSTNAKMRSLVVAMLNYGAAAQLQFGYKTDSLMNSFLSDEQKALVDTYSSDMVASAKGADISKTGSFAYVKGGYTALYPRVSFEGAFGINYYFTPAKTMDGNLTMYYWTLADYTAADILTPENATGVITMDPVSGSYTGSVEGIAARQIDETVYVAGIYESGGIPYPTGVIAYSLGAYCVDRATNDTGTMQELAKHTAVYGYYAKNYFADLAG